MAYTTVSIGRTVEINLKHSRGGTSMHFHLIHGSLGQDFTPPPQIGISVGSAIFARLINISNTQIDNTDYTAFVAICHMQCIVLA